MAQSEHRYPSDVARIYFAQGEEKGRAEGEARGRAEGEARGRAEGEARALLAVLEVRGLEVSDAQRARILNCADPERLERWVRRAVTVKTTATLLAATGWRGKART